MIAIENMEEYSREIHRVQARDISRRCRETSNCDTYPDKECGQPCPCTGNLVDWRVRG